MDSRIVAPVLMSLLMAAGLNAQEISTSPAVGERLVDVQGVLVAPEAPMLVLHVPVSLQAISPGVSAYVVCQISTGTGQLRTLNRQLTLTDNSYDGVVSFYWEDLPGDDILPQDWSTYDCRLVFCGNNISGAGSMDYPGLSPSFCRAPTRNSNQPELTPDLDFPFTTFASGDL